MKRQWLAVLALTALAVLPGQVHGQYGPPVGGGSSFGSGGGPALAARDRRLVERTEVERFLAAHRVG